MKRALAVVALLGIGAVTLWMNRTRDSDPPPPPPAFIGPEDLLPEPPGKAPSRFLADKMLADYGSEESSPKNDLKLMGRFIDSVFLLIKNRDTRDYATNEDLALFLQGANAHREPYLGSVSTALNKQGQLIDRWGSPLMVHPVSQKVLEIRSAGPDQKPYTDDDLSWPERLPER